MDKKKYTLEDLMNIVSALRGEGGCPWDQAQTHASMKDCMLNEAQEVVEGINLYEKSGESENLCEELGDVLFQVVFHSQIGMEEGLFSMDDVLEAICKKMIRRHPHVFGENKGGPIPDWEEVKRRERELKEAEKLRTTNKV